LREKKEPKNPKKKRSEIFFVLFQTSLFAFVSGLFVFSAMPPRSGAGSGKKGKGKSTIKGGSKRHKKTFRDQIKGITKPALRRLARRAGVKRISANVYEDSRSILRTFLESVVYHSLLYKETFGRKTISLKDVVSALKRRGNTLVGAEQHQTAKKKGSKKK